MGFLSVGACCTGVDPRLRLVTVARGGGVAQVVACSEVGMGGDMGGIGDDRDSLTERWTGE